MDWSTVIDATTIANITGAATSLATAVIPAILGVQSVVIGIRLLKKFVNKAG